MRKLLRVSFVLAVSLVCFIGLGFLNAQPKHMSAIDSYEVSLQVKPELDFISLFEVEKEPEQIQVAYYDTEELNSFNDGWTHRVRHSNKGIELVHKKRYLIQDSLDDIIVLAKEQAINSDYELELDWSYEKQLLSVTYETSFDGVGYKKLELPDLETSKSLLGLTNKNTKSYGDITYERYKSTYMNHPIVIEVWPDGLTEVSFKTKDYAFANSFRQDLLTLLGSNIIPTDSLKTEKILKNN